MPGVLRGHQRPAPAGAGEATWSPRGPRGAAAPSPINQRDQPCPGRRTSLVSPTRRPARITATRSAQASTSSSLWVISTTARPGPRQLAHLRPTAARPRARASTDVGSSRITTRAPRFSTLASSTSCFSPTVSSPARRRGSMLRRQLAAAGAAPRRQARAPWRQPARRPRPGQHQVLGHRQRGHQAELLEHHADARAPARPAANRALSGWPSARISPASAGRKP